MSADLRELAEDAIRWLKARGGVQAELYLSRAEDRGLELRHGKLDAVEQAVTEGMGLRVCRDGRMGFASSGGLSKAAVELLFEQAVAQLPHQTADAGRTLPQPRPSAPDPVLEAGLNDDSLFQEDWERVLPRLEAMGEVIAARDSRVGSILRLGYGESRGEVVIASTAGIMTRERGGSCSVAAEALAGPEDDRQTGSAFQSARRKASLDYELVARECAGRATALLGARKLPGGKRSIIFDPWVAGEFLELIAGLLCADSVQRGKSLLAGRLGKKVASALVTFVDDPRRSEGLASSLFDDEGLPTTRKVMIDKGVVRDYFYDTITANRDKREGNACAGRGSYKGMPGPDSSNFYLEPGGVSRDALIRDTQDGILLLDVMGMHMVDPISGEFSVGVSGLRVSGGSINGPVKNAMISGNLLELLASVDAVADDLTFHGSMGAPTFRVAGLNVA